MHLDNNGPPAISEAQVLTRATIVAAERMGLDATTLAAVIGVSETSIARMKRFEELLRKGTPPCDRALLLIRLFRALHDGRDTVAACTWLQKENPALGGRPVELITGTDGLCAVVELLHETRNDG